MLIRTSTPCSDLFWLPKLAEEIAQTEAFLLLIGPKGIGPWQEVEYFTAFDRHVSDKRFALVPVMVAGAEVPGLSFLRTFNWIEAPVITEDKVLHRLLTALKGETVASANAYPPKPDGYEENDMWGRSLAWSTARIWALEAGGPDGPA